MQRRRPDLAALEEVAGDHEGVRLPLDRERADAREGVALGGADASPDTRVELRTGRPGGNPRCGRSAAWCRSLVRRSVVAGSAGLSQGSPVFATRNPGTAPQPQEPPGHLPMAEKPEYHALVLSSIPETLDEVTAIANEHFQDPTVIYWEMGNTATKAAVLEQIEATPYNVIISYINGIILKRRHLDQAVFGAVNIHPARRARRCLRHLVPAGHPPRRANPPRRDGARDGRGHRSRAALRGEALGGREDATIQSVVDRTSDEAWRCAADGREAGAELRRVALFETIDDSWDPANRHHRSWMSASGSRPSIRLIPPTGSACRSIIRARSWASVLRRSLMVSGSRGRCALRVVVVVVVVFRAFARRVAGSAGARSRVSRWG